MIKHILFFLFLIGFIEVSLGNDAKRDSTYSSIVKVEVAFGGIQFEKKIGSRSSFNLGLGYHYKYIGNPKRYDFQITSEIRYYLFNKKEWPYGAYLGGYLFFKDYIVVKDIQFTNSMVYSRDKVVTSGLGLNLGYQVQFIKRILLDFDMGLGYNIYCDVKPIEGLQVIDENKHHLNFTGGISVGYIF